MVGSSNSTILTVSYGTFSCTLEGFDDSFDMMKAIAEYFRDLAADDRYFGAEPPTPDAEMLARIAEKEVSRKVEAVSREGGVTLRPYQIEDASDADIDQQKPASEEEPAPAPATASIEEDTLGYVENEDYSENFFPATEAVGLASVGGSVAARLQRIRDAAAQAVQDDTLEDAFEEIEENDLTQEEPLAEEVPEDGQAVEDETETQITDAETAETPEPVEDFEGLDEGYDEDALLDDVALDDDLASDDIAEDEDEDEDDFGQLLGEAVQEDAVEDAIDDSSDEGPTDEEFAELLKGLDTDTFVDDEDQDDAPRGSPFTARVVHVKGAREGDDDADAEALLGDDFGEGDALATDTLDAIFDEADEDLDTVSTLSDEDEADLMRELAQAETDEDNDDFDGLLDEDAVVEVADTENLFSDNPEEALANAQDLSALLTGSDSEVEVDRLMDEAESHLTSADANRRRSTIQHLKAAVASKRADSAAGDVDPDSIDASAYVEDLNEAVKPKRPVLRGPSSSRERATPVAPLKLVAEQKVVPDSGEAPEPRVRPTLVKPVRPRRVRATAAAAAEAAAYIEPDIQDFANTPETFVAFAKRMDVSELPEILEAAAAYVVYSEGLEKFSRPQLMNRVREVLGKDYTREDGLRAFGRLLREGKILKVAGGRFTAAETIGFRPE